MWCIVWVISTEVYRLWWWNYKVFGSSTMLRIRSAFSPSALLSASPSVLPPFAEAPVAQASQGKRSDFGFKIVDF